ncbi:RNase P subunit p30 family protein [Halocatena halophila]|uniref:RNase P subunit p30 family protein n=1 Tax=Halocatena halophila TaxID=2814576 RepID=UPI002ED0EB58
MFATAHARPDGVSSVARFALTARESGFDGLVVRNHDDEQSTFDRAAIAAEYDMDVVHAVEIRSDDRSSVASAITKYRPQRTIVCVHGGQFNRLACEDPRVDVLCHPMADGEFNHVLASAASTNGVAVEFNFGRVLRATGGERVHAISGLQKLRTLVEKYDVPFVVSADPSSHLELRSSRELKAVGETVGFSRSQIQAGLERWAKIAARNRARQSESFIEPGVYTDSYEEVD